MSVVLELVSLAFGLLGVAFGVTGIRLARMWTRDCRECRVIVGEKNRTVLDMTLTQLIQWNKNLPNREQARGGVLFRSRGVTIGLARPKIAAPSVTQESRVVEDAAAPERNRAARRAAAKGASS